MVQVKNVLNVGMLHQAQVCIPGQIASPMDQIGVINTKVYNIFQIKVSFSSLIIKSL